MNNSDPKHAPCFCVFYHVPFVQGTEGDEDGGHIYEQLLYQYPDSYPKQIMEHFLGVLISLYTFTSLSHKKKLDFLSWSNTKVAIRTFKKEDDSLIFFVLRVPSEYSDLAISREIDLIKQGIIFALGPEKMSSNDELKGYLLENGNHLSFASFLPLSSTPTSTFRVDPIPFSFSNIPNAEWHRPNLASVLIEVAIMQTYPEIWGISCFLNGLLLASHMPTYMIRFFDFVPPSNLDLNKNLYSNKKKVYLTKEDRMQLLGYPNAISKIPDQDYIECSLFSFQHELVTFYVLADPNIPIEVFEKVHERLSREMIEISSDASAVNLESSSLLNSSSSSLLGNLTTSASEFSPNTIVYNNVLNILEAGLPSDEFQRMAIEAHDLFAKCEDLRDIVMNNAKEFMVCMNILNVEFYAAVNSRPKEPLNEMYNKAIKAMPGLQKYLRNLHLIKE